MIGSSGTGCLRVWPRQATELIARDSRWRAAPTPDGITAAVPESVPGRSPTPVQQHPAPTKFVRKNRPEIREFRPVLRARVTLANRRLQPLGHLTADVQVYGTQILARSRFSCAPYNGFSNRRTLRIRPENRLFSQLQRMNSGVPMMFTALLSSAFITTMSASLRYASRVLSGAQLG
jgi:hypothetical protein